MNPEPRRWRILPRSQLRLRYWDGECVLFHGASGDTHRLPELVGHLLECLEANPANIDTLVETVDLHPEDVERALRELAALEIVEPAP